MLRFAENPRDRVAGFRVLQLLPGIGPSTAASVMDAMAGALDAAIGLAALPAAAARRGRLAGLRRAVRRSARPLRRLAGRSRAGAALVRAASRAHPRGRHDAPRRPAAARADRRRLCLARALPDRADARPADATSDQAGPPHLDEDYLILSTIHSAKGQEWKQVFVLNAVDGCIPSDLGVGTTRGDRGGAAAALCRDDAGQGRAAPGHAAALLRRTARPRAATATSTPRAPASSRPRSWRIRTLRLAPGRRRGRAGRPARGPRRPEVAMRGMWR